MVLLLDVDVDVYDDVTQQNKGHHEPLAPGQYSVVNATSLQDLAARTL